jgi:hypothetical protein
MQDNNDDDDYPDTIVDPEAFKRDKPADFDGVFDWEYLHKAFRRGIKPTDEDAKVNVNHFWLRFETKALGVAVPNGQRRSINDDLDVGLSTWITVWGKQAPVFYQVETALHPKGCKVSFPTTCSLQRAAGEGGSAIVETARRWFEFVDGLHREAWLDVLDAVRQFQALLPLAKAHGIGDQFVVERSLRVRGQ